MTMSLTGKAVFFQTYGCSHNIADSEQMAGMLSAEGMRIVQHPDDADIVIINGCAVKGPSEKSFFQFLDDVKAKKKEVVLAGCIPQALPEKCQSESYIGTNTVEYVAHVVKETLAGKKVQHISKEHRRRLNLPKYRSNPVVEIIACEEGCLSACSYCLTKKARGNLRSFPVEDVVLQAQQAVNDGVKEIRLTGEDSGCYGMDIGTNLAALIRALCSIEGDFKIRVGMANPNWVVRIIDDLLDAMDHPKVYKFLHLPLQAGNNKVLKEMRRQYDVEEYLTCVQKAKAKFPTMTIATDIICGFPGETAQEFDETLELVRKTRPEVVNISRFYARDGTDAAARADQVHGKDSKARSRALTLLFRSISEEENATWKGWQGDALIVEQGTDDSWIARNDDYKQIIVKGNYSLGDTVTVKITDTTVFDLKGDVLNKKSYEES